MPEEPTAQHQGKKSAVPSTGTGDRGRILAQWMFPEYDRPERGKLWYVTVFAIMGLLIFFAIRDGNFLFVLIILLFALIIFTHHRTKPVDLAFVVYETGLRIGDRFYWYREIESFAVIYEPPLVKRLYLKPRGSVLRHEISIPLFNNDPMKVRSMLLDYVDEDLDREAESPNDMATRVFKL